MTESKVEDELAKMGFTLTYVPRETYWTSRLVQNRTIKTERQKPLIPRYVFLAIGSEVAPWYEISLVQDIVGVLSIAGIPRPVPARELARIATMEKQGWFDDRKRLGLELAAGRPIFEEGDQVRITGENAFAGLEALLAADSTTDSRVNLLVSMFGRMTPIVLPMSDIELVKAKRNRLLTEGGL